MLLYNYVGLKTLVNIDSFIRVLKTKFCTLLLYSYAGLKTFVNIDSFIRVLETKLCTLLLYNYVGLETFVLAFTVLFIVAWIQKSLKFVNSVPLRLTIINDFVFLKCKILIL